MDTHGGPWTACRRLRKTSERMTEFKGVLLANPKSVNSFFVRYVPLFKIGNLFVHFINNAFLCKDAKDYMLLTYQS